LEGHPVKSPTLKLYHNLPKKWAWLLSALLLAALVLTAAYVFRSRSTQLWSRLAAPVTAQAAPATVEVRRGELKKQLLLDGELRAVRSRTIFANTSEEAKIVYLPLEGSTVKAGDRLVELDSGTILDKIKDAEDRIAAAESEIVRTKSQQESQLREMDVELSRLWLAYEKAKVEARVPAELLPRRDYQERQLNLEKSKTEYENQLTKIGQRKKEQEAELQVKIIDKQKLNTQLNQAKGNLDGMNIKAPSDGMVIYTDHWNERRKIQVGDVVWGGFPVVRLPDLSEMEVLAQVNEVDGPRLATGQRAKILLDSYPEINITGSVKEIAQTAVKASWMAKAKIFRVIIGLDQTVTEIMKPGMSAQVFIVVAETGPQLLVPRAAIQFDSDSAKVLRLEGENLRRPVAVTIIAADPIYYAVAGNGALKEGDRILSRWTN
jgi:multidrug efflux pump subunit AcrA (membrane-fusion protein)